MMQCQLRYRSFLLLFSTVAMVMLASAPNASAQSMPGATEASPNIYKVLAEDDTMRVILGTWQPGDRDEWHGHPPSSVFFVTDCHIRVSEADGRIHEHAIKSGIGRARNKPVKSHSIQNIGTTECRILMTEFKLQN